MRHSQLRQNLQFFSHFDPKKPKKFTTKQYPPYFTLLKKNEFDSGMQSHSWRARTPSKLSWVTPVKQNLFRYINQVS